MYNYIIQQIKLLQVNDDTIIIITREGVTLSWAGHNSVCVGGGDSPVSTCSNVNYCIFKSVLI